MKDQIEKLKKEKNAVILAHYYVPDEIQEIADYVGDSFFLAKIAKQCAADILVFCGVSFMGESAKILNPGKKVLMPDSTADCPMAHMVTPEKIADARNKYDDLAVACYVNSTAELKALSDVCVTSSNAVKIVKSLPNKNIFFIPDRNLGKYVAEQVPEKNIILNDGGCPIHVGITAKQVEEEKKFHPHALVLSHPECADSVLNISDFIGSTSEIIDFVKTSDRREFIICTEEGVSFELNTSAPEKIFYFPTPLPVCPGMKLNTLKRVLDCLKNESGAVEMRDEVREKALAPLEKMLELAK